MQQLTQFIELQINAMEAISFIVSITSLIAFVFMYNREQKRKVDSDDIKELKGYVDQQDRSIHNRINGVESRMVSDIHAMRDQINAIHTHLLGKK